MRALFFGDRNLTWRHLPVLRALALHAALEHDRLPPLDADLLARIMAGDLRGWPTIDGATLIHGDGPPGTGTPGSIGADKLAELACMETWPERRRVRRFPPRPGIGETWAQAAIRRNAEMVAMKPDRAYCVHLSLDSSKGSRMTADMLSNAGLHFWHVKVSIAGAVLGVEYR